MTGWCRRTAPTTLLLALAATTTACGSSTGAGVATAGGGASATAGASSSPSKDPRDAAVEFAQCMRDHGLQVADPDEQGTVVLGDDEADEQKMREAHEACRDKAPPVGVGPGGGLDAAALEQMLKFSRCMREHGIDMEDPVDGRIEIRGRPGDEQELEEAQEACQEFAPGGDGDGRPDPARVEQMRVFAQCMRDNGVPDFPDPDPDGGVRIQRGEGSGVDEEAFRAAEEACRDRLPAPPGGGSGS